MMQAVTAGVDRHELRQIIAGLAAFFGGRLGAPKPEATIGAYGARGL